MFKRLAKEVDCATLQTATVFPARMILLCVCIINMLGYQLLSVVLHLSFTQFRFIPPTSLLLPASWGRNEVYRFQSCVLSSNNDLKWWGLMFVEIILSRGDDLHFLVMYLCFFRAMISWLLGEEPVNIYTSDILFKDVVGWGVGVVHASSLCCEDDPFLLGWWSLTCWKYHLDL